MNRNSDIIALTETRLNTNTVANIDIQGYDFYHNDSDTMAGGIGLYVKKELDAVQLTDINLNLQQVESCWIEIKSQNSCIVIGCIYRHPSADIAEFSETLETVIEQVNANGRQVFLVGDFNIDFLKIENHPPTENYV